MVFAQDLLLRLASYTLYFFAFAVFGYLAWSVYKEIKEAKGKDREHKKREYLAILAGCLILYTLLTTVWREPMNNLYWAISDFEQTKILKQAPLNHNPYQEWFAADNKTQILPAAGPGELGIK